MSTPSEPPRGGLAKKLRKRPQRVPPPEQTSAYRVLIGGFAFWPGLTRGLIALIIIGTLIGAQFSPPASASTAVNQAVQTLAIAVIGFYFGTRTTLRPKEAPQNEKPSPPRDGE